MQLITAELAQRLPAIGETKHQADPMVQVMFSYPDFYWIWYGIEFDGLDLFFGLVDGESLELGYFRLSELQAKQYSKGPPLKRHLSFAPCPLSKLMPLK